MKINERRPKQAIADALADGTAPIGLLDAPRLLETVWTNPECRPTVRWLREQQKLKTIPFIRVGRLVWFSPDDVVAALRNRHTVGGVK
jgi:hypothetical protein